MCKKIVNTTKGMEKNTEQAITSKIVPVITGATLVIVTTEVTTGLTTIAGIIIMLIKEALVVVVIVGKTAERIVKIIDKGSLKSNTSVRETPIIRIGAGAGVGVEPLGDVPVQSMKEDQGLMKL